MRTRAIELHEHAVRVLASRLQLITAACKNLGTLRNSSSCANATVFGILTGHSHARSPLSVSDDDSSGITMGAQATESGCLYRRTS
jgi:hypothetical protein